MNKILIVCDGKEIIFNSKHKPKDIYNFISMNESMVVITDSETQEEIYLSPNKVSVIQEITKENTKDNIYEFSEKLAKEITLKIDGTKIAGIIREHDNPHTAVIIKHDGIKIVSDEMYIPLK